jgi:hypothetical protein
MFEEITGIGMTLIRSIYDTAVARTYLGITIITIFGVIAYRSASGFLFAAPPVIVITTPQINQEVTGKQLYVQGKVTPTQSQVLVNGEQVYSNGDGSFSQVVDITEGKNIIKVTAENYGKKADVVQMVTRNLSPEEIAAKQLEKQKKEAQIKEEAEKIAQKENAEKNVLGAEATPQPTQIPNQEEFNQENIVSKQIVKVAQGNVITGKYQNKSGRTIRWVKLVAKIKDEAGQVVDTKDTYITQSTQLLAPLAEVPYTIPITTEKYTDFELTTSYEII